MYAIRSYYVFDVAKLTRLRDILFAYEPVWAIGTGVNAEPEDAESVHKSIFLGTAFRAAMLAGSHIVSNLGKISDEDVDLKQTSDFVTRVDRESEQLIVTTIRQDFPDHRFLTEETIKDVITSYSIHYTKLYDFATVYAGSSVNACANRFTASWYLLFLDMVMPN